MSTFTYQILKDTTEKSIIKLTGVFDSATQENNSYRIQANSLYGALDANSVPLGSSLSVSNTQLGFYDLQVTRINYNVNMNTGSGHVMLYWQGETPAPIAILNKNGEYSADQGLPSIPNNATGASGHIGISTAGAVANSSYTIVLELRKNNQMYQRGQFDDPAAFNYGNYSITP